MRRSRQSGFTLVESIIIVAVAVAIVIAIWQLGWVSREPAGETSLETHIDKIQTAVNLYFYDSNGRYPTDDGKLPAKGEYKAINWDASFSHSGQRLSFCPNYVERKPKYWNEGVWRIDSAGNVSVNISPEEY